MSEETGQALSALLAKLEAATEGSGKLSWDIAEALGWTKYWNSLTIYLPPGATEESGPWHDKPPAFSESLDAAMTLVPPTHFYLLIFGCKADGYTCSLGGDELRGEGMIHYADPAVLKAHAKTEPLALCIAAVRARLAGQKEHP